MKGYENAPRNCGLDWKAHTKPLQAQTHTHDKNSIESFEVPKTSACLLLLPNLRTYIPMPLTFGRGRCSQSANRPCGLYVTVSISQGEGFAQENCLERPAISCLFSSPLVVLVVVRETAFAFNLYHCRENSRLRPNALSLDPPPRKVRGFAKSCVLGLQPRIELWIRLELIEMFTFMQLSCFKDATTICRWNKVHTYHRNCHCVRVHREIHGVLLRNETPRS